jgi:PIN domain nuclease of toxin-antitoxin system
MPMNKSPRLLLDTHAWLWLMSGTSEFSSIVQDQIEQAAQQHPIYISAISVWEVGMLVAKKRIQLQQDVLQWVQTALKAPGTQLIPLLPEIAIESTRLPGEFHGDPADRMIVATARHAGITLLTRDEKIVTYAQQGYLNVIAI